MMGSACSMQRSYEDSAARTGERAFRRGQNQQSSNEKTAPHCSLRHAVVTAVPDRCISTLYPVDENYVVNQDGTKTPKSLAELATDAVCRSLVNLDGSLPPGLPPDVVQDIYNSLHEKGAWNATTLAVLRQCELERLDLTKAKGVTDEWLHALTSSPDDEMQRAPTQAPSPVSMHRESMLMDLDHEEHTLTHHEDDNCSMNSPSASVTSFMSATSNPFTMSVAQGNPEGMVISQLEDADDNFHNSDMGSALDHKPNAEYHLHRNHQDLFRSTDGGGLATTRMMTVLDLSGSIHLTDKGLANLQNLQRLEEAHLDNCHSITGRGLSILASSHHLHTLSLVNCRRLTDAGVVHLSNLMSLESLNLSGCRCLTDRSLAAIADLYALRHLDMSQCDLLTDAGIEQLTNLEHLEEINLGWCRQITDRGLEYLTSQPGRSAFLRRLCLARCAITDGSIDCLSRLKALEELNLNGCLSVGSAALGNAIQFLPCLACLDVSYCRGILRSGWQGKINHVKSLDLSFSGVRDSHLSRLSSLAALEELNLDSCPVGDAAFAHLANDEVVPNLTSLDLADTSLTDVGMVHIAKFKKLTRLSLFYCNISNRGLRHISQLRQLQVLNLDSRDITDDGVRCLRDLPDLRSLDIFSGRITDIGCVHISRIKTLESLELCGGAVGDAGCVTLASLVGLTHLNLSQNEGITNQGAAALGSLTYLRTLNLSNTSIDSGALRFFTGLTQLHSLALYGCHITDYPVRIEWLKSRLPNLRCLRIDRVPEQEGKFLVDTSEESSCDEEEMWTTAAHAAGNHDSDTIYSAYA